MTAVICVDIFISHIICMYICLQCRWVSSHRIYLCCGVHSEQVPWALPCHGGPLLDGWPATLCWIGLDHPSKALHQWAPGNPDLSWLAPLCCHQCSSSHHWSNAVHHYAWEPTISSRGTLNCLQSSCSSAEDVFSSFLTSFFVPQVGKEEKALKALRLAYRLNHLRKWGEPFPVNLMLDHLYKSNECLTMVA